MLRVIMMLVKLLELGKRVLTVLLLIELAGLMQMVAEEVAIMFAMMMMTDSWRSLVAVPLRKRVINTSFRSVRHHTSHVTRHLWFCIMGRPRRLSIVGSIECLTGGTAKIVLLLLLLLLLLLTSDGHMSRTVVKLHSGDNPRVACIRVACSDSVWRLRQRHAAISNIEKVLLNGKCAANRLPIIRDRVLVRL
jgi:hypothetical protein